MGVNEIILNGQLLAAVPIAIAAGLVSFLSPCVLPLVPGYLGYLGGFADASAEVDERRAPLGCCSACCCSSPGSRSCSSSSRPRSARSGRGSPVLRRDRPRRRRAAHRARPGVHRAVHVPAAHVQAVVAPGDRARGCAAARHRVRPRLDAVHRPDARGRAHAQRRLGSAGARCSASRTASASASRSCSSRSASDGPANALAFVRRHIRVVNLIGGGLLIVIGLLMVSGLWTIWMYELQAVISGFVPAI